MSEVKHWIEVLASSSDGSAEEPPDESRQVRLGPIDDELLLRLYHAAVAPDSGAYWRFHGTTTSFEAFIEDFYRGTLCQFAVTGVNDGHAYGAVVAYRPQLEFGHCYVAFLRASDRRSSGQMSHGLFLLIEHLFSCFPLRQIYVEMAEFNFDRVGLPDCFEIQGRLRDHTFLDGRYWDQIVAAVTRDRWELMAQPLRSVVGGAR